MNVCLENDLMLENQGRKFEMQFWRNRCKSNDMKSQKVGALRQLISLIKLFRENLSID